MPEVSTYDPEPSIEKRQGKGISIPRIASDYGVSEKYLYNLAHAGLLAGCTYWPSATGDKGRYVVRKEKFEAWLDSGMEAKDWIAANKE